MNRWISKWNALVLSSLSLLAAIPAYTEMKITPYGFIKFDAQYNSKDTQQRPSPPITDIPWNNDAPLQHGQLILDARRARFGFKARDTWKNDTKFLGVIEADFYTTDGDALTTNPRHLRFRLGYAQFTLPSGFFVVGGQQRSLMQNTDIAEIEKLDDNGPVGSSSLRQPQLRLGYSRQTSSAGLFKFEIDAEKQSVDTLPLSTVVLTKQQEVQKLPLFVSKLTWKPQFFETEVAGAISKAYTVPTSSGREIDTLVWGLHNASQLEFEPLTFYYRAYYLNGLSRLTRPRLTDCVIVQGELKPVEALGGYAGIRYDVNKFLSINVFGGWAQEKRVAGSTLIGENIFIAKSGYVNFIYKFWKSWKTGLEYQYDDLVAYNGTRGTVNIIHSALWFYF